MNAYIHQEFRVCNWHMGSTNELASFPGRFGNEAIIHIGCVNSVVITIFTTDCSSGTQLHTLIVMNS